jgi:predicted RNase H-like HicB family nuclease
MVDPSMRNDGNCEALCYTPGTMVLTDYLDAAMHAAAYDILEDGEFYGAISGLDGVYATAGTLEGCRDELRGVLEEWVALGLRLGHPLPPVGGVTIDFTQVA